MSLYAVTMPSCARSRRVTEIAYSQPGVASGSTCQSCDERVSNSPVQTAEPRLIYLIGLMGSGKTTVGEQLAAQLGCDYLDNDATIADLAGRTTVALAEAGGTLLHDWESRYVQHVQQLRPPVVCGIPASAADRPADLRTLR